MFKTVSVLLAPLVLGYIAVMDRATDHDRRNDRGDAGPQIIAVAAVAALFVIGLVALLAYLVRRFLI